MFHSITTKVAPYFSILNQGRYKRFIDNFKKIPYNEQYETHDFIKKGKDNKKLHYLQNNNYEIFSDKVKYKGYKTFDETYQLSYKFKNIPYNEQYETHDYETHDYEKKIILNDYYYNYNNKKKNLNMELNRNYNGEPMIKEDRKHNINYDNSFCEYL
jgi:hypothetical protein